MSRRLVIVLVPVSFVVITLSVVTGLWVYENLIRKGKGSPPPPPPVHVDTGDKLPTQEDFDALAKTDPVKMLSVGLSRYEREVKDGVRFTFEMQERVKGSPKHPEAPPVQVIDVCVRGDVPDPATANTAIEVVMKWRAGAKKPAGLSIAAEITGSLFSEKPPPDGFGGKVVTWQREKRFGAPVSDPMGANSALAQGQSRYCIRDAGLYRTLLRTHTAWKARQDAGEFKYEYLGTEVVEKAGGRECHKIRRICVRTEVDAFELGGKASNDPKVVAAEGFTEVVLYIDRERWLQVGSEVYRTEGDTKVTVGTYFFRDVDLKSTFADDTFDRERWHKK